MQNGSVNTNAYEGRYLHCEWYVVSQSIADNSTTIHWKLTGGGGNTTYYYNTRKINLIIDGVSVYYNAGPIKLYYNTVVAEDNITLYHDGQGNKTFSIYLEAGIYTASVNKSGTASWDLPNIPRYASINYFSISQRTGFDSLNSVQVNYSVSDTCDAVWYSTDNGNNWYVLSSDNVIYGLEPGTGYNFKLRVRRQDSQLTTDSNTVYQETVRRNYISEKPNEIHNDEQLHVVANNPSGCDCQIVLELPLGTRRLIKAGTDVTFTVDEINSLLQYIESTSEKLYITADTLYNNEVKYSNSDTYIYYNILNSEPEFKDFSYQDVNDLVTKVTDTDTILVKNKSLLQIIITPDNKMVAKNYAKPVRYEISCGNRTASIPYTEDTIKYTLGTISNVGLIGCTIKAIDSRTLITAITKQIQVVDYFIPTMVYSANRVNNFEDETTIKISGSFSKVVINNVIKNNIKAVMLRYKKSIDVEYSQWQELNVTVNTENGTYKCDDKTLILDKNNAYDIQLSVLDNFESNVVKTTVNQGIPIMFISGTDKNVGVGGVNKHEKYSFQCFGELYLKNDKTILNTIYPIGSIYYNINDVNPSELFGGTWESQGNNSWVRKE